MGFINFKTISENISFVDKIVGIKNVMFQGNINATQTLPFCQVH